MPASIGAAVADRDRGPPPRRDRTSAGAAALPAAHDDGAEFEARNVVDGRGRLPAAEDPGRGRASCRRRVAAGAFARLPPTGGPAAGRRPRRRLRRRPACSSPRSCRRGPGRSSLSVGHCGRAPRRYRGRDFFWWLRQILANGQDVGVELPTVDRLPDPRARFACNPHLSGHDGGHDTDLREFAERGSGSPAGSTARTASAPGSHRTSAPTWRIVDGFFDERFRADVRPVHRADRDRRAAGRRSGTGRRTSRRELTELDLAAEGISTVLWTSGYAADYGWLDLPILDDAGLPRHVRGVTEVPGLTVLGMLWLHDQGSANLAGVAMDAEYLSRHWT